MGTKWTDQEKERVSRVTSMVESERKSDYTPGKSVREVAHEWLHRYQNDDDINSESAYGIDELKVLRFTLAGGGPSAFVDFTFRAEDEPWDGEPLRAEFVYSEGWGVYDSIDLDEHDASALWERLMRDPDEGE